MATTDRSVAGSPRIGRDRQASPQSAANLKRTEWDRSRLRESASTPTTKVALTIDSELLERVDELVDRRRFRNRSQAIAAALADKLERLARTRLARESAKLDPREEKRLADEGLVEDLASWPEY